MSKISLVSLYVDIELINLIFLYHEKKEYIYYCLQTSLEQ